MTRRYCSDCQRVESMCICSFIEKIDNHIPLGIIQHPSEVNNSKGTAVIVKQAFSNVSHWVAETVGEEKSLLDWMAEPGYRVVLLYPQTEGFSGQFCSIEQLSTEVTHDESMLKCLVLDGTWRKSYKMMLLNPELQRLERVALTPHMQSSYQIRKQKDAGSLSTVEAVFQLYSILEQSETKFKPLLRAFDAMQQQQLRFRPE